MADRHYKLTLTMKDGSSHSVNFVAPQGEPGPPGGNGADAEQIREAIDRYLEENQIVVTPGKDGVSATHRWNGTVLTITSASGTSSADLKGEKGDKPQKGVDYWTDADKQEIIRELSPPISAAGMLIYVDADGNYAHLSLGAGLSIVDGVLTLNGTITPDQPNDTTAVLGAATLGTMVLGNGG